MSDLFWLSPAQMRRIEPYFPLSHGIARVDDRRVISGIIFVIRNGLRWRDAPAAYGPHKTIYNRFVRWRKIGVWDRLFAAVTCAYDGDLQMVDSSSIRVHQHAANVKKEVRRQPPLGTSLLPAAWGVRAAD